MSNVSCCTNITHPLLRLLYLGAMEMQVTARRKMGKVFCLLDHKWKTVNIHWFNNIVCKGMLTNWWFLKMVWIWLSNVSWSECFSYHTIQGCGFRGDMILRHDLCFSIESRRGDRKMGQTTGKPISCPEELPAAGVHSKMEKNWIYGVSALRYTL